MHGIGHAVLELIRALEQHPERGHVFDIHLMIAYDKKAMLDRWGFQHVTYKLLTCPLRPLNLLWKFNLLPPMDLFVGRGIYLFPNYKNWRLVYSRSLTYVHDIGFVLYPQFVSPKNQIFLAKNMRRFMNRTTIVVADSYSVRQEIIDQYQLPKEKVVVMHHGVDTTKYYPRSQREIEATKKKYGIHGDYIFYLGNIEPRKNLERLIDAYRQLPKRLRDRYSLVIVGGSGWLNAPILRAIEQAQQAGYQLIKPAQFVPDEELPALHSGATILAHPAIYEGFGLSLVQAMACGTPVLTGNKSSMPEIVGDGGLLVESTDTKQISDTMKRLLMDKDLRARLAEKGLQRARKFSWQTTAKQLVSLIKQMQ